MSIQEIDSTTLYSQCRILVVDDEEMVRHLLTMFLSEKGCELCAAATAEEGLALFETTKFDVALVDIWLPGMDGMKLLNRIKDVSPETEVIIITGHASIDTSVQAMREGAYDYLIKPFGALEDVWHTVKRAHEKKHLSQKTQHLLRDFQKQNLELSATVRRLTSFIEAGRAMCSIHSLPELLDFFIELVVSELNVERASLMLLNETTNELQIAASRGIDQEIAQTTRMKLGEGIAGKLADTGEPILVKDVKTDPRMKEEKNPNLSDSFVSFPIVLSVPIKLKEKVLGVINLTNKKSQGTFDDNDMAFLFGLAGQAAVAIEATSDFEKLQQAYESLKSVQKQLLASERQNTLGQLGAGIAHEVKNPLAGILGFARLSLREVDKDGPLYKSLLTIEKETKRCKHIIENFLKFSRQEKVEFAPTEINKIVEDAATIVDHQLGLQHIRMEKNLTEGLPSIMGNGNQIQQVLMNLFLNAQQAMEGKPGLVRVTTQLLESKQIEVSVSDTGKGMPKDIQEKIFEPFFTTKPAGTGTGLGLSVSYGIIKDHGGDIRVHSEPEEGTVFVLTFPVMEKISKPETAPEELNPAEQDTHH